MNFSKVDTYNNPLVSICIPTFNGERFLRQALDSAIYQTYKNIEIVLSDDESIDKTVEIIEEFKSKVKIPVKYVHHKPNGIASNWNNTIKLAQGTYIKFLFQDDVLNHDCIEKMVNVLEYDKNIALVTCKREIIAEIKNRFSDGWLQNFQDLQVNLNLATEIVSIIEGKKLLKSPNFKKKPINIIGEPTAIMFRKEVVNDIGYFKDTMFQLVDYEFCLRLFKKYKIAFIDEKLVQFRLHSEQASFINNKNKENDQELYYWLVYQDYFWWIHSNFKWFLLKKFHFSFNVYRFFKKMVRSKN